MAQRGVCQHEPGRRQCRVLQVRPIYHPKQACKPAARWARRSAALLETTRVRIVESLSLSHRGCPWVSGQVAGGATGRVRADAWTLRQLRSSTLHRTLPNLARPSVPLRRGCGAAQRAHAADGGHEHGHRRPRAPLRPSAGVSGGAPSGHRSAVSAPVCRRLRDRRPRVLGPQPGAAWLVNVDDKDDYKWNQLTDLDSSQGGACAGRISNNCRRLWAACLLSCMVEVLQQSHERKETSPIDMCSRHRLLDPPC